MKRTIDQSAPSSSRIRCEVPFCRRTVPASRYEAGTMIICRKHWLLGDARARNLYKAAKRKFKRTRRWRYHDMANRMWERVRRQAIERAGGL